MADRPTVLVALVLLAGMLCGCGSTRSSVARDYDPARVRKIAVVDVGGDLWSEAAKNQIAHFFTIELLDRGYDVVERRNVKAVFEERDFQEIAGLVPEALARARRLLDADAVLYGELTIAGDKMSVTAQMVDVDDARVLWTASGAGSTNRTIFEATGAVIGASIGWAVGGDREGKTAGGVGGGIAGAVIGGELSPQRQRVAEKIVGRMCRRLPGRDS